MKIVFPDINPMRMVLVGYDHLFADGIPYHEESVNYNAKVKGNDTIYILYAIPDDADYTITAGVYDCNGYLQFEVTPVDTTTTVYTGYKMYMCSVNMSTLRDEGIYYFKMTFEDNTDVDGTVFEFTSEPMHVRVIWANTVLLEYYNEINDFDVPFEDLDGFRFQLRVEGGFPSDGYQPNSKDAIFIDQNHIPVMLDSIPYVVKRIQFGASYGIPNWLSDRINRALSCTHFYVEGLRYCKNEGAKLEATHETHYPLSGWSIDLIGIDEEGSSAFSLSRIYVLGAGDEAFRAGYDISMFPAKKV